MILQPKNKLATTSLILGLVGWGLYILQWCFDLSIGLLLSAVTAGASAVCSTVLDVIPFLLWLVGIVIGHLALGQISQNKGVGRSRAIWGLVLNYSGLLFILILAVGILLLIGTGIGVGVLNKVYPFINK
jgi:hypothetical protein